MNHKPNHEERARRAEALAESLAEAVDIALGSGANHPKVQAALNAWEQHKADYGTLDQHQPGEPSA